MGQRPGMFPELVDRERRRQVALGVDLGGQFVCFLLDRRDRIGACDPAEGWVLLIDDGEQCVRKLGRIAAQSPGQ